MLHYVQICYIIVRYFLFEEILKVIAFFVNIMNFEVDYIYFWSVLFIYHSKAKFNLKSRYELALVSSDSQLWP